MNRSGACGQHDVVNGVADGLSDADVLARSLAQPDEFAAIFDRHFVIIYRYVARRIGPDDAEDIAGEAFRIAFERRHAFDSSWSSARPWLYGIATNVMRGRSRSESRRVRAVQRATVAAAVTHADDDFERAADRLDADDQMERVGHAIAQLADGDRDALLLFAVEGLSYGDVAHALSIPVGTVRSRINRARTQVRELLNHAGQLHPDRHHTEGDHDG